VSIEGDRFSLEKSAAVVSYGTQADGILATARRARDAVPNDQVMVLALKDATTLAPLTTWDTLGFRGTCSEGYLLRATGPAAHVLPEPFADIAAHTMVPTSHVLWASLWLGIATDAVNRARAFIRSEARRRPGVMPSGAHRLAEAVSDLQMMRATVHEAVQDYARCVDDREVLSTMGFALRMNNLKIMGARSVVAIVAAAMQVTGISGYRRDSRFSVERHLRDAYGAGLMINTDRVCDANAAMLLVAKDG
jgi:acyl-CoA dehydrogenase